MSKSIVQHKDGDLIMRQRIEDGYINLNDIAKSTGKRLDKWLANKTTQGLFLEFEKQQTDTPNSGYRNRAIISTKGGAGGGSTWAHPQIAIQFAQWCSPAFALWCSRIIIDYMTYGAGNPLWQENRKQLKDSNARLGAVVKAYVTRHVEKLSDNKKRWMYKDVNDKLAIAIIGCNVAKFKRINNTNSFRDALNKDQLRNLELLELVVIKLIEQQDVNRARGAHRRCEATSNRHTSIDAVENAKERLMLTAS